MISARRAIIVMLMFHSSSYLHALSSLSRNDPYPVYTSLDPHDFLLLREKLKLKNEDFANRINDNVCISFSPFGQNADSGRTTGGSRAELGDLGGRWGMIPLLYGPIPAGQTLAPTLETALNNLFPGVTPGTLNDGTKIDPNHDFGYFSLPLEYRKRGVRFQLLAHAIGGFGINLQAGVASMSQTTTGFHNLTGCGTHTCPFDPAPLTNDSVNSFLMDQLKPIADEIKLDICDFCQVSAEEVRLNIFWRKPIPLNQDDENWPNFILTPFIEVGGSVSPAPIKDPNKALNNVALAVPFGSGEHSAVGFTAGFDIDFVESIEIGAQVGITHFFEKSFDNYRVPTSEYQTSIFPYRTSVSISPGLSWQFGAKLASYHFLDKLSGYFEYVQVEHKPDDIDLKKCDDEGIFLPGQLEKISGFMVKIANMALNYDISPNMSLGIFWQAPLSQKNAYRSSTVLFSLNGRF